ncbi:MAG: lysophospholipid acyltransferase family protein [Gemmatimonadota bacterium]|nr:lysophospholipid acyltransferase family protein [Gemmatimonadota bacterium]
MAGRLNRVAWNAFDMAFRPWMRHHLSVCTNGFPVTVLPPGPVVLVSNHVSWWDGFLLRAVQKSIRPQSAFYTIALERELEQHPILRMIGGVGMIPSSPSSILHSMRVLKKKCVEEPDTVIGFFPQGRIAPSFTRPLAFTRGIELFARRIGSLTVLPIALHIEPVTGMAPTAFVRVGEPIRAHDGLVNAKLLEDRVESMLDATLASLSLHGEDSVRHWDKVADADLNAAELRKPTGVSRTGGTEPHILASEHHA